MVLLTAQTEAAELSVRRTHSFLHRTAFLDRASVNTLAWHPNGRLVATAQTFGREIQIWDLETGISVWKVDRHNIGGSAVAFVGESKLLIGPIAPREGNIPDQEKATTAILLDYKSGAIDRYFFGPRPEQRFPANAARTIAVSPDGLSFAVLYSASGSWPIGVYDLTHSYPRITMKPTQSTIASFNISADFRQLAIGTFRAGIQIFDLNTGQSSTSSIDSDWPVNALAFSADGAELVMGAGMPLARQTFSRPIQVWSITKDTIVSSVSERAVRQEDLPIRAIAWIPNTRFVAFGAAAGGLRLWHIDNPAAVRLIDDFNGGAVNDVKISPDGKKIAAVGGELLQIFQLN